jgi:hypothetical protein
MKWKSDPAPGGGTVKEIKVKQMASIRNSQMVIE